MNYSNLMNLIHEMSSMKNDSMVNSSVLVVVVVVASFANWMTMMKMSKKLTMRMILDD